MHVIIAAGQTTSVPFTEVLENARTADRVHAVRRAVVRRPLQSAAKRTRRRALLQAAAPQVVVPLRARGPVAPPGVAPGVVRRLCSLCRAVGHNARTCDKRMRPVPRAGGRYSPFPARSPGAVQRDFSHPMLVGVAEVAAAHAEADALSGCPERLGAPPAPF